MIWTDCDREGEHIGSEVAQVCRKANPRIIVKRARFSAIIAKWALHSSFLQKIQLTYLPAVKSTTPVATRWILT